MKLLSVIFSCVVAISLRAEFFYTPEMLAKHLETYTEKEVQLLEKDLAVVRSVCFDDTQSADSRFYLATAGSPFYLATAGAPGARKTTTLERFVAAHPEYQKGIYLDADARALKFMVHTYYAQSLTPLAIAEAESYDQVIKNAYDKWRYGSTWIGYRLFEEAATFGRSIIFGTTSTGAHVPDLFSKLKKQGYQIVLLLCSCPDNLRRDAVEYRNQVIRFYQSSPDDAFAKGKVFPQRMGTYFAYADIMYFYWSDDLASPEKLAAVWREGKLEVHDPQAMQRFVEKYEADRAALAIEGQRIPSFESYLQN
ncbi:MAG: zeta toxin family protein [Verrucomicrobia bacterium]|nr:zeta toxin family protein [Verrucomicrobiota bacterium]